MNFSHESSNPNPNFPFFPQNYDPMTEFELSDYLMFDDTVFEEDSSSQSMASPEMGMGGASNNIEINGATAASPRSSNMQVIL
ncbi:hypothetical protein COLO4_10998 [Corchorus olitorius]|uniref:Uncharacterized protein n=1 Tax=Corchorus olitorius TaxID=93759 RepID=A0A1R3K653_9ROSI|nr:hypothetical protein COLO4_10998 [Corchorus olitorius]